MNKKLIGMALIAAGIVIIALVVIITTGWSMQYFVEIMGVLSFGALLVIAGLVFVVMHFIGK